MSPIAFSHSSPFVKGGLMMPIAPDFTALFTVEGGIDHWPNQHAGVRVEILDHI